MLQQNPDGERPQQLQPAPSLEFVPFQVALRAPKDTGQAAPWHRAFDVTPGVGSAPGAILLAQVSEREFLLGSTIRFRCEFETGLEKTVSDETINLIREVGPATLSDTDLGSVPGVFGWFLSSYGIHTPAVLIHDRLIGWDSPPSDEVWIDQYADRYLRFMLKASGVSWLTRWLMWTAVAFRTRWVAPQHQVRRRIGLAVWLLLAIVGITSAVMVAVGLWSGWPLQPAAFGWSVVLGSWGLPALFAVGLPLPASMLWGKQRGAGLIAVLCGPLVLPPALAGLVGYGVYRVADRTSTAIGRVFRRRPRAVVTTIRSA